MSKLGNEVQDGVKSLACILAIIIIHSILKSISESLENDNISKLIYYVQYIAIITVIMSNFSDIITISKRYNYKFNWIYEYTYTSTHFIDVIYRKYNNDKYTRTNNFIYDKFYWKSYSKYIDAYNIDNNINKHNFKNIR